MSYIALGCLVLALILKLRGPRLLAGVRWRYLTGAFAVVAFTAAAYAGVREAWAACAVLLATGAWLALATRRRS